MLLAQPLEGTDAHAHGRSRWENWGSIGREESEASSMAQTARIHRSISMAPLYMICAKSGDAGHRRCRVRHTLSLRRGKCRSSIYALRVSRETWILRNVLSSDTQRKTTWSVVSRHRRANIAKSAGGKPSGDTDRDRLGAHGSPEKKKSKARSKTRKNKRDS